MVRGLVSPKGIPLFKYCTTELELETLVKILKGYKRERSNPAFEVYWCAGTCLYIAEQFRRNYDSNWSWKVFDNALELNFSANEHKGLVDKGLKFWGRPIRYRVNGADYLGSLFAEGGLPWKLLQSEGHGFGRAIKAGLKHYHECNRDGHDLASVICEYGQYFPQSFQNNEKYQLLTKVVETLMLLAEQHSLNDHEDPAAYLNSHFPQWRDEFPLPLGEENGYALVNEWLRDASVRLEERMRAEEMVRYFTCEHRLDGSMESARLQAEVRLAPSLEVKLDGRRLSTTRVELALYEGGQMILTLGAAYGRQKGDVLFIKLPVEVVKCRRKDTEKPLFLVCSCAGEKLSMHTIQFSEVDWNQLPAVFVEKDQELLFVGIASVQAQAEKVFLRVPAFMKVQSVDPLIYDEAGGVWYSLSDRTVIHDSGSNYVIEPGSLTATERVEFQGVLSPYDTLPIATWLGCPRCMLLTDSGEMGQPDAYRINNQIVQSIDSLPLLGCFRMDVLGPNQEVLARRKLGVLPNDFSIMSMPASSQVPARVMINTMQRLNVRVLNDNLCSNISRDGGGATVELMVVDRQPDQVLLEVSDPRSHSDAIVIRLPYPEEGVQLLAADGKLFDKRELTVDRILGMSLVMTPPSGTTQTFHLSLGLMGRTVGLEKHYAYSAKNSSIEVSLFSLYDDILSLLSTSSEQDAVIRCRVETTRMLQQFDIRRYEARICFTKGDKDYFELVDQNGQPLSYRTEGAKVMAMQVQTPEAAPVALHPQAIQDFTTGVFELPQRLQKDGPWLLYPAEESIVFFRPAIYLSNVVIGALDNEHEIKTLNSAARYYHPVQNPDVFTGVFDVMAGHFLHSSWLYLIELKGRYPHIPLSAFESWKHLTQHPEAMALALFRLEMSASFAVRLQQELAVIWEAVTFEQWKKAAQLYIQGVSQQFGIPEEVVKANALKRMQQLSVAVPVFKELAGELCEANLETAKGVPLTLVLPIWLRDLRARQEDAQWPINLQEPLTSWMQQQEDYAWMLGLEMPSYMRSVCFMPVFAACLTAGLADVSELAVEEASLRFGFRVLSDFDRDGWYEPVYSATLSGLLHAKGGHS